MTKYVPIQDFTPEDMLRQATTALDLAAKFAIESKNVDGLVKVGKVYLDAASRISAGGYDDEETRPPIGFTPNVDSLEIAAHDD